MINKINYSDIFISSQLVLIISFFTICLSYYYLFSIKEIIDIVKEEYILSFFVILFSILHFYAYFKLKDYDILPFIPKLGKLPIKQSIFFFIVFEVIDYIYEDGVIGAIKLWYMYWLFGILSLNFMYLFNYYKNFKFYNLKLY